jgi:hypothetical protein
MNMNASNLTLMETLVTFELDSEYLTLVAFFSSDALSP